MLSLLVLLFVSAVTTVVAAAVLKLRLRAVSTLAVTHCTRDVVNGHLLTDLRPLSCACHSL
jgi:hypothetical protein